MPSGRTSLGVLARKESSERVSLRSVCALPTDLRNGSGIRGQQHLPGDEAWLIGEHRASGEKKYYLANLPAETNLRTRARSLRGSILARPPPTRAHDNDRLRVPSTSSPHPSEAGKKESTDRHLSQARRPCVTPSSTASCDRFSDAHTAEKVSA